MPSAVTYNLSRSLMNARAYTMQLCMLVLVKLCVCLRKQVSLQHLRAYNYKRAHAHNDDVLFDDTSRRLLSPCMSVLETSLRSCRLKFYFTLKNNPPQQLHCFQLKLVDKVVKKYRCKL